MKSREHEMLNRLHVEPADPLLSVTVAFEGDERARKLDLGVGVYRDDRGLTPVMGAVKAAERRLVESQETKAYVGARGDLEFVDLLTELTLGPAAERPPSWGIQTPGGTAALRLAADILVRGGAESILLGTPTWANHEPVLRAAGLTPEKFAAFEIATQKVDFAAVQGAIGRARPGDAILLQASCHNPTGVDFSLEEWRRLAEQIAERGLIPLIDAAYLGLGDEIDNDAKGLRLIARTSQVTFIAVSLSKSFGLYRERTGALLVVFNAPRLREAVVSNALAITRANYSMPPDHGAAVARIILSTPALGALWLEELDQMRSRIRGLRRQLASHGRAGGIDLSPLENQRGLFSLLPLSKRQIALLRERHGVYLVGEGRTNIAGLTFDRVDDFVRALADVSCR
ncbi:MAG: aromatic amino acid transaminase [Caulobacteraceae bacterium]